MRYFALKGLYNILPAKKKREKILYPPQPPCDVVPLFKLPAENNKHPNLRWRRKRVGGGGGGVPLFFEVTPFGGGGGVGGGGGGGGGIVLFFEVTPFKDNVSVILLPIAGT